MDFLEDALLHVVGHACLFDAGAEIFVVFAGVIELGELFADGAQLLAKDVLALRVVDRLLDVLVDLGAQLRDLDLAREQRDELAQAGEGVGLLEEGDAIVEAEVGTRAGDVGDQLGLRRASHGDGGVGADLGAGVDVLGEQRADRSEECVHLGALDGFDRQRRDGRDPRVARRVEGVDANAFLALDEGVGTATREAPERADVGDDRDACARRRWTRRHARRRAGWRGRPDRLRSPPPPERATERGRPAASGASCDGKTTLSRSGTAGQRQRRWDGPDRERDRRAPGSSTSGIRTE